MWHAQVRAGDYRIHVFGFSTVPGRPRCDHAGNKVSFVKAHIDGRHRVGPYGRVGH